MDPKVKEFAGSSAFAFAFNNPLIFLDKGGEYPITPEQMHAILSVFVQAVETYAKAAAKSDFSENYLQTEVSPPFIAMPLNVLPMYEPGEYNEGFGKAKIVINDSYSISVKVIVNSPVNDSERSSTVVTRLKFEIGETGYFKDGKVNRIVLLAGAHRRVTFDLGNDLQGSMLVNFFKTYYDEVYNSAMYQEAIIADNVLGREYGSGESFQEYFDAAKPEYRNARETSDKSMSVKEDQINIEINVDGNED